MSLSLPIPKGILRAELFGKSASDRVKQHGKTVKFAYGGACKRKRRGLYPGSSRFVIDCCNIIVAQAKTDKDIWEMEFSEGVFPAEYLPMGAVATASGTEWYSESR